MPLSNAIMRSERITLQAVKINFSNGIPKLIDEISSIFTEKNGNFEEAKKICLQKRVDIGKFYFVIIHNKTKDFLGYISVDVMRDIPKTNLFLISAAWGEGYGIEIFSILKEYIKSVSDY